MVSERGTLGLLRRLITKNYTKGLWLIWALASTLAIGKPVPLAQSASPLTDFSGWHLPVPAGEWAISQGPCNAPMQLRHKCNFYEDQCALDLDVPDGDMTDVPVLAPYPGLVVFVGERPESGRTVMVQHPDGRVSVMMHLSQVVVGLDEGVTQGQVLGYAGGTGNTVPHLHFFVQPSWVERECIALVGLDVVDYRTTTATSYNLPWPALSLTTPPTVWPSGVLPLIEAAATPVVAPKQMVLAPGTTLSAPLALRKDWLTGRTLIWAGQPLTPTAQLGQYVFYTVPWQAPQYPGEYRRAIRLIETAAQTFAGNIWLTWRVRAATAPQTLSVLEGAPTFVSPPTWSDTTATPTLCWRVENLVAQAPLTFRVWVVGPTSVTSEWQTPTCWQAPTLAPGQYYWKVQVRDAQGFLNRPTQRPWVFRIP